MPETAPSSSRIAHLSPNGARVVLVALVLVVAVLAWVGLGLAEPPHRAGPSDLDTYERVVAALKAGQGYYRALHAALLEGGYGTLSPLNWRTPLFLTVLSWFPTLAVAQLVLEVLTVAGWAFAVAFVYRRLGRMAAASAAAVMALSLIAIAAPRAELSFELCAGTLILISVSAYGLGWKWLGLAAGTLALFVRELGIVYVFICLIDAMRRRSRGEVIAWLVCLGAYGAYYQFHAQQVAALIGPDDHAAAAGWLQFGGIGFVLRTAAFNGVLLALPYWVAGIVLPIALLGLTRLPLAGITVALYLLVFLLFGRPENDYWGAIYAPLVAMGLIFAPSAVGGLLLQSRRPPGPEAPSH